MSTIVSQIHAAIGTQVATTLGATYQKMRHMYVPETNDLRNAYKSYCVLHGAASNAEGITRVYTLDQEFRVQILNTYIDRLDDANIQSEINTLYDKIDSILVAMFLSKLGLPSIVLIVNDPAIEEPKVLGNQAVMISFRVNVRYRNSIA